MNSLKDPPLREEKEEALLKALEGSITFGLLPRGEKLLVAVSGGADSVGMIHALARLADPMMLGELVVAHVDHGLRRDSFEDALAVESLATRLELGFKTARVVVEGGGGLQAAARRARYKALEDMRLAEGAAAILTAHTADDQAETLILRMARGTSVSGLAGIRPRAGVLIRPLLGVTRQILADYCARWNLPVKSDPGNFDPRFRRARVRHEVLPLVESRLGPGVREALCRLARVASEESRFMDGLARKLEARAKVEPWGCLKADLLVAADDAVLRRALVGLWYRAAEVEPGPGITPPPIAGNQIERLLGMLRSGGAWQCELPGGVLAVLSQGRLLIGKPPWPRQSPVLLGAPGTYDLSAADLALEARLVSDPPAPNTKRRFLLPWPSRGNVVVRGWMKGDAFSDGRKLSDVLQRARVPRPLRGTVPVLLVDGEVRWALGLRSVPIESPGPFLELVIRSREGTMGTSS